MVDAVALINGSVAQGSSFKFGAAQLENRIEPVLDTDDGRCSCSHQWQRWRSCADAEAKICDESSWAGAWRSIVASEWCGNWTTASRFVARQWSWFHQRSYQYSH